MSNFIHRLISGGDFYFNLPKDQSKLITHVDYRLLTYGEYLKAIRGDISKILPRVITTLYNFRTNDGIYIDKSDDYEIIVSFLDSLDTELYNDLIGRIIKDSQLTTEEYRKIEYITYYLNWKADNLSRRMSYNCDKCHQFNYIKSRLCFLENDLIRIPKIELIDDGASVRVESKGETEVNIEEFFGELNKLSRKELELPIFEIGLKYFSNIIDDDNPNLKFEVCPEAIKIKSFDLAEILEMENRTQEYGTLPFNGNQSDQPNLLIEIFDAIRIGRSLFQSKKMEDLAQKAKEK